MIRKKNDSHCTSKIEEELWKQGYKYVVGIDEVGRGAWAGPVVVAAVILDPSNLPVGVDDSKKLSEKSRNKLFPLIQSTSICFAFGEQDSLVIDRVNILEATRQAMYQAVETLPITPDYLLVDALTLPNLKIPQQGIIRGDSISISIGAASILAKVYRDKLMSLFDEIYAGYSFSIHKGYGTALHSKALQDLGPCPIHRKSFRNIKNIDTKLAQMSFL